jgi:TatD DNase family protein
VELVDTHCHLDVSPLWDDLDGVLTRARAADVAQIVAPAYDLASWEAVAQLGDYCGVHLAFGLHPWAAEEPLERESLVSVLREHGAVAVGEIGVDSKRPVSRERQLEVVRLQLEVARDLDLPVLLHCRGWHDDLLAEIGRSGTRGVYHAFSRGAELALRFVERGIYVAFGGSVTRANASKVLRAIAEVPLDRVLLETDAPSIAFEGIAAEQVEPCHVPRVAEVVAEVKRLPYATVADATTANAAELFSLP